MTARLTSAQEGRQRTRTNGKYAKFQDCYGECGGRVNPDYYISHSLTDCRDAEGEDFGDLMLMICPKCQKATANMTTVREVRGFVANNVAKREASK
jgi:hypothetical protein